MRLAHLLPLVALAAACTKDDHDDHVHDDTDAHDTDAHDTDGGDTDAATQALTLSFAGRVGDATAACGTSYDGVGAGETTVTLKDFRLFVHGVRVLVADGAPVPLTLDATDWQTDGVALLDFEDATGPCSEFGTAAQNTTITGTIPADVQVTGLAFELGLPYALDHLDVGDAPSPLDTTGMYWVWRSGYKYLRVDLLNEAVAPDNGWFVHVGAAGCVSDSPTTPPPADCAQPNVATVTLDAFDPDVDTIVLDVAALVAGADVSANTAETPPGCMSSASEPAECDPVYDALGLDFTTGLCADGCAGQTFVRVE